MSRAVRSCVASLVLGASVALSAGCHNSASCAISAEAPPSITILDAKTGAPICDALVLVTQETLTGSGSGTSSVRETTDVVDAGLDGIPPFSSGIHPDAGPCPYAVTSSDEAVFTLQVSKPGYQPVVVSNVYITSSGGCDLKDLPSENVVIPLHRTGS